MSLNYTIFENLINNEIEFEEDKEEQEEIASQRSTHRFELQGLKRNKTVKIPETPLFSSPIEDILR